MTNRMNPSLAGVERRTPLFQLGFVTLHSGQKSRWKIECDALTKDDWDALALMLVERLPEYGAVEGVPRGGLPLAEALDKYQTEGPLLIVDDVLTTGGSMEEFRAGRDAIGVVVFARSSASLPWVTPLFRITEPNGRRS